MLTTARLVLQPLVPAGLFHIFWDEEGRLISEARSARGRLIGKAAGGPRAASREKR